MLIVAPTATPSLTETSAWAPLPLPVRVTRLTPVKVKDPSFGVRPIPAFEMVNVPEAVPAVPTKSPVALVVCWKNVLPISYPESATVVPRPTLIFLEFNSIASGRRVGICLLPSVNSGL